MRWRCPDLGNHESNCPNKFPLAPEMFDLVIIDEASQCDIPSAIPLLYRSKKAVIIGDPNQLRHVATLATSLDKQIGEVRGWP
jgi:hypothetical protein